MHLRAADPLGDLMLQEVLLEAQANDLPGAVVQNLTALLERRGVLELAEPLVVVGRLVDAADAVVVVA